MSSRSLIFLALIVMLKLSLALAPESQNLWVVWDIGQGQWVTHILNDDCRHYDFGGELGSYKYVQHPLEKICGHRRNVLFLSHWDYDHFLNITAMAKRLPYLCWAVRPEVTRENISVVKALSLQIPACAIDAQISNIKSWYPRSAVSSNDRSIVHLDDGFLLPGDSPKNQERKWSHEMQLASVRVLILGHHGSRTSTGFELLNKLPNVTMAVASARLKKYGHPHIETLERLRKNKTPVLKTEDWGSLWFL